MFPEAMPPNDDLDLQVLWLKVLEEKGAALTADDLAAAWLEGCWYPFNEYGIFRRNWRWASTRLCPGVSPTSSGRPARAARSAPKSGVTFSRARRTWRRNTPPWTASLDHSEQSVGAEMMLAAMSSMAFFVPDVRRLVDMFIHYLPAGSPIERLTRAAFQGYDEGLSLRDARDRLMALAGVPEACDAQINIPFTFLGLLYGGNDLQEVMLSALRCGYDTDCTLASAAALVGQILGASRIPAALKTAGGRRAGDGHRVPPAGDDPHRPGARHGPHGRAAGSPGMRHGRDRSKAAPALQPLPATAQAPAARLRVDYAGLPAAAPGESVTVTVAGGRPACRRARCLTLPPRRAGRSIRRAVRCWTDAPKGFPVTLHAPAEGGSGRCATCSRLTWTPSTGRARPPSGWPGPGCGSFLGVYYDALPDENDPVQQPAALQPAFRLAGARLICQNPNRMSSACTAIGRASWPAGAGGLVRARDRPVQLVGLRGPYCAYLARAVISPEERRWIL